MQLLYRRAAALDVHKKTVCACIREAKEDGEVVTVQETFQTFTDDLERLRDWLKQHAVRRVAMESTGVYWIPVWNVLEPKTHGLELLLVNPTLVKALPGCKTDKKDAARIAELHQYGLLRGSFVPPRPIRKLRDLVRRRTRLTQDRTRVINRIARLLECANVKLGSVASNIVGVSGRKILRAMSRGECHPERLAKLALGRLRDKSGDLVRALRGRFSPHFRFLLKDLLEDWDYFSRKLDFLESAIRTQLTPQTDLIARLCTIPGVDVTTAWTIIAEMGLDMGVFPNADHAANWAGVCPGNRETANKRLSGRTRKGDRYLRRVLVQTAWAISHRKDGNFLTALFYRHVRSQGRKKAALTVAHRVQMIAYHILRDGEVYHELGGDFYDRQHPERTAKRLLERLRKLGLEVELRAPTAAAAPAETHDQTQHPAPVTENSPEVQKAPPAVGSRKPTTGDRDISATTCSRCARWGIACIHARPKPGKSSGSDGRTSPQSTG